MLTEDLASLMEEPPVVTHGKSSPALQEHSDPESGEPMEHYGSSPSKPKKRLYWKDNQAREATQDTVGDPKEFHYLGMTAHRGVLQSEEWVDHEALIFALEMQLGISMDEIREFFSPGGLKDPEKLAKKIKLEDKFLELQEAGGNMALLGSILGFRVKDRECRTMQKALRRARQRRNSGSN